MANSALAKKRPAIDSAEAAIAQVLVENQFPIIPQSGIYNVATWAALLQVSQSTITRWAKKYRIPVRKPGDELWIDAEDFLKSIPQMEHGEP